MLLPVARTTCKWGAKHDSAYRNSETDIYTFNEPRFDLGLLRWRVGAV